MMQEKAVITVGTKLLNRGEGMGFNTRRGDALGQKQTVQPFSEEKSTVHSYRLMELLVRGCTDSLPIAVRSEITG